MPLETVFMADAVPSFSIIQLGAVVLHTYAVSMFFLYLHRCTENKQC